MQPVFVILALRAKDSGEKRRLYCNRHDKHEQLYNYIIRQRSSLATCNPETPLCRRIPALESIGSCSGTSVWCTKRCESKKVTSWIPQWWRSLYMVFLLWFAPTNTNRVSMFERIWCTHRPLLFSISKRGHVGCCGASQWVGWFGSIRHHCHVGAPLDSHLDLLREEKAWSMEHVIMLELCSDS